MKRSQIGPQYIHKHHLILKWLAFIFIIIILILSFSMYRKYQQTRLDVYPIRGVSVDQQDGYLDFVSLANTNQKFIYIRATQGSIYSDDDFNNNYQRCEGSNMLIGVYHIFSFDSNIHDQEVNFNREVSGNTGSMPIGIKVSNNGGNLNHSQLSNLLHFIQDIKQRYHRSVMVWTTQSIYTQITRRHVKCFLWLNGSSLKEGSKDATLIELQANESLQLDGQSQNVTQSAFNGNKTQWNRFIDQNVSQSNQD
ncbi:lysozyme [Philodulcilactobacillus myokoensis]|uniref:Lysozyme n=1 Tax=Philodulcilactobacillus myokoensis TaxID=2929573 RepID=A0A9W6ET18_9LACO|nr:GH25 family lysozyme [Philodulcilactobacillus myokoensis]GLB47062.1 lysozyme [Philodulcilactobacillus myokoensis]